MLNAHLIDIMASNPNKYKYCKPGGCQASVNNKYVSNIYLLILLLPMSNLVNNEIDMKWLGNEMK